MTRLLDIEGLSAGYRGATVLVNDRESTTLMGPMSTEMP